MPVVGVIDPTHDARKQLTGGASGKLPKWYKVDEILQEAATAEPKWSPWPYELLAAALGEVEDRGEHLSTTALVSPCPRSRILQSKADYITTMEDLWRAFRGTMIHYVLEAAARPGSIAEVRFHTTFANDDLSCKPDLITENGVIWDYKNTAKNPLYNNMYPNHVGQLQLNRYIVSNAKSWEKDGKEVALPFDPRHMEFDHLVILYLDLDGPKPLEYEEKIEVATKKGALYPTKKLSVPTIWSDGKVEDMFVPLYQDMRLAMTSYPDFPEVLVEKWGGDASWKCPGYPWCPLKGKCLASRWPNGLIW